MSKESETEELGLLVSNTKFLYLDLGVLQDEISR